MSRNALAVVTAVGPRKAGRVGSGRWIDDVHDGTWEGGWRYRELLGLGRCGKIGVICAATCGIRRLLPVPEPCVIDLLRRVALAELCFCEHSPCRQRNQPLVRSGFWGLRVCECVLNGSVDNRVDRWIGNKVAKDLEQAIFDLIQQTRSVRKYHSVGPPALLALDIQRDRSTVVSVVIFQVRQSVSWPLRRLRTHRLAEPRGHPQDRVALTAAECPVLIDEQMAIAIVLIDKRDILPSCVPSDHRYALERDFAELKVEVEPDGSDISPFEGRFRSRHPGAGGCAAVRLVNEPLDVSSAVPPLISSSCTKLAPSPTLALTSMY